MKYLTNAVNFAIKNWLLILPVFVLTALASLIGGVGKTLSLNTITSLTNMGNYTDPGAMLSTLSGLTGAIAGAGIVAFIAKFIYEPATYGLVNKSLDSGNAGLNDIGAAISSNFVKYVIYFVGMLVVGLVVGIAFILIGLLCGLLISILKGVGIFLAVIIGLAMLIVFIVLFIMLSLWFSAMVVDSLDIVAAAKKSIEVVKGCFWTVLGISLLIAIAFSIIGSILRLLAGIPLIGPIIYSAAPAAQYFLMATFLLMVYRERTGRTSAA